LGVGQLHRATRSRTCTTVAATDDGSLGGSSPTLTCSYSYSYSCPANDGSLGGSSPPARAPTLTCSCSYSYSCPANDGSLGGSSPLRELLLLLARTRTRTPTPTQARVGAIPCEWAASGGSGERPWLLARAAQHTETKPPSTEGSRQAARVRRGCRPDERRVRATHGLGSKGVAHLVVAARHIASSTAGSSVCSGSASIRFPP